MRTPRWLTALAGLPLVLLFLSAAAPPAGLPPLANSKPLVPEKEKATFALPKGFRAELVACEPNVIDPVAMAFDERGRIFVAEMLGYPNEGVGTGFITSGRIKLLEDRDGDGFYETSTVYADNLRFPTGLMPWRGGLLVANAPELIYLDDPQKTGKATRRRVLYKGFDVANIQQLLNSLQFALDNRIHACAGGAGGTITSAEKPDWPAVTLRGRGIRFNPDVPGSLEPTSGGGQYGLSADDWGRWFTATNSQHLRHIILPDHYLRRNPALPVSAVTLDIPEHGAACKVFRKSPFEAWRVERTTRRAGSADARRFPTTELVPGGFVTSACSPLVYTADLFPAEYRSSVFVCDPANNVIIRDVLTPNGATFIAKRGHADCEFLASTDNWFRPVHLTLGPDGAIYVLDFYREVIETPLSLPDDIKRRVNLQSRARGRIWRITTAPPGTKPPRVALDTASAAELVEQLANANSWWRLTAQRLLFERKDKKAIEPLRKLLSSPSAVARAHALWTLDGLNALWVDEVKKAVNDPEPGVREQALKLAERVLKRDRGSPRARSELETAVLACVDEPLPLRVRFQLALTLGEIKAPGTVAALARLARRPDNDRWTETAILSSVTGYSGAQLLEALAKDKKFIQSGRLAFLTRLAALVGTSGKDEDLATALSLVAKPQAAAEEPTPLQIALLDGLGQGLAQSARPLSRLWDKPPPALEKAVARARVLFSQAARMIKDEKRSTASRVAAVRLLGSGPFEPLGEAAPALLSPRTPPELQLATVRALSAQPRPEVAKLLLAGWGAATPALRREMTEALFARPDRLQALLSALEKKTVLAAHLEPARLDRLKKHPNRAIRQRAAKVLAGQVTPQRSKVIDSYRSALELKSDVARGKGVFKKVCATCHRLEDVGVQVGADLLAALRNKSPEQLLIDILDPSREVDPRYLEYQVTTRRGQVLTGLIAAETASSLTLKRGEGAEDTILRTQIDKVESTGKSLMPEGLEMQMSKQDLADLIAYLQKVGSGK
jgi:putative membrane-bound dehydrogenase-like protein